MWERSASVCDVPLLLKFCSHKSAFCIAPHSRVRWGQIASAPQGCAGGCHCPALLQPIAGLSSCSHTSSALCKESFLCCREFFLTKCFLFTQAVESGRFSLLLCPVSGGFGK